VVDNAVFTFGPFRLNPAERLLLENEKPLRLGSRALEILIMLVERAGETVLKDQLIGRVWPDTVVGEGALRVHVAALRKALGDGRDGNRFITSIPGRGYSFVALLTHVERHAASSPPEEAVKASNLPVPLARVIGRDDVIANLTGQLAQHRLLTIVGPGGIGKTTVAIAVAENAAPSYGDGVWFVGLASLPEANLITSALGAVLGIALPSARPLSGLVAWLRDKHGLIVLDSCEHVVDAAAEIAEAILQAAPQMHILATSRERLRADGEWLHRLSSLELPPLAAALTAADAMQYSAIELFNERVVANVDEFALDDTNLPAVLEICRRLDGVPLALELAAARVDAFGLVGIAARLDDRFTLLTRGRRTALPRHQTLRATMDWSYELLPDVEQTILQRLAVFRGSFTLAAAMAITVDQGITRADVLEGIANLVMKSLVTTDLSRDVAYHWLLDTTHAYALERLNESGKLQSVALRHAEYYRDLLIASAENQAIGDERSADYARDIDNVRAALAWAFEAQGARSLAVALATASPPLWLEMSLLSECGEWMERAIAYLDVADRGTRRDMQLQAALGFSLMFTKGMTSEAQAALTTAVELAERFDDPDYQLRTLFGLCVFRLRLPDFRGALALARQCAAVADRVTDPSAKPTSHWMLGLTLFCLGDLIGGRAHMERVRDEYRPVSRRSEIVRFGFDQRVYALGILGLALWIEGFPQQARAESRASIAEALALNHPVSLCIALWTGCLLSLWVGDLATLERSTTSLLAYTEKHSLDNYHSYGLGFAGELAVQRGDAVTGVRLMRAGLEGLRNARHQVFYSVFLGGLAKWVVAAGDAAEGLGMIGEAVERAERSDEAWYLPELLRIKGELQRAGSAPNTGDAEQHFLRSLHLAHRQGALSWELRAATSLARLYQGDSRQEEARNVLAPVCSRFTEGFETADLSEAERVLQQSA